MRGDYSMIEVKIECVKCIGSKGSLDKYMYAVIYVHRYPYSFFLAAVTYLNERSLISISGGCQTAIRWPNVSPRFPRALLSMFSETEVIILRADR
jgi:hypothetical protein